MRDQLQKDIEMLLINNGVEVDAIRSNLVIILNDYEVQKRTTELAILDEDEITKYMRLFLISKRVAGRTERTLNHYKNELQRFFSEIQKNPTEICTNDIKMYLAVKEVRDNVSKVYQQNMVRVLSSFFNFMVTEEYILKNPMNKLEKIKVPKVKKEAFTETDIEKLRFEIGDNIRFQLIFEMLLSTWCRVSELVQIKKSDIAPDMKSVLVHGKGQKDRKCYLNAKAELCLQKYLSMRTDDNEYLFPKCNIGVGDKEKVFSQVVAQKGLKLSEWWRDSELIGESHIDKSTVELMVRRLGRSAGVKKVHPHRFRRTGATFALRRGMPIEQVSKLLGHESIETTQIYLDISENELENAHKKYV